MAHSAYKGRCSTLQLRRICCARRWCAQQVLVACSAGQGPIVNSINGYVEVTRIELLTRTVPQVPPAHPRPHPYRRPRWCPLESRTSRSYLKVSTAEKLMVLVISINTCRSKSSPATLGFACAQHSTAFNLPAGRSLVSTVLRQAGQETAQSAARSLRAGAAAHRARKDVLLRADSGQEGAAGHHLDCGDAGQAPEAHAGVRGQHRLFCWCGITTRTRSSPNPGVACQKRSRSLPAF